MFDWIFFWRKKEKEPIPERLVIMQTEDGITTLEKDDGNTIHFPSSMIPSFYSEGDIVTAIVYSEDCIKFLSLDSKEMKRRQEAIRAKKEALRNRIKNNA